MLKVAAGAVAQEKENEEWKDLQELMEATKPRLYLKLDNVRDFDGDMYDDCINKPSKVIPAFERALNDLVRAAPPRPSPWPSPRPLGRRAAAPSAHRRRAAPRSGTWTRRTDGRTG